MAFAWWCMTDRMKAVVVGVVYRGRRAARKVATLRANLPSATRLSRIVLASTRLSRRLASSCSRVSAIDPFLRLHQPVAGRWSFAEGDLTASEVDLIDVVRLVQLKVGDE